MSTQDENQMRAIMNRRRPRSVETSSDVSPPPPKPVKKTVGTPKRPTHSAPPKGTKFVGASMRPEQWEEVKAAFWTELQNPTMNAPSSLNNYAARAIEEFAARGVTDRAAALQKLNDTIRERRKTQGAATKPRPIALPFSTLETMERARAENIGLNTGNTVSRSLFIMTALEAAVDKTRREAGGALRLDVPARLPTHPTSVGEER